MVDMPRPETSVRQQITDYALGMLHESLWILGMTLFAFIMAVVAMAVFK
jgi:ABC-type phosphate transport system permease subunit